jgi:hypothetical protein
MMNYILTKLITFFLSTCLNFEIRELKVITPSIYLIWYVKKVENFILQLYKFIYNFIVKLYLKITSAIL